MEELKVSVIFSAIKKPLLTESVNVPADGTRSKPVIVSSLVSVCPVYALPKSQLVGLIKTSVDVLI